MVEIGKYYYASTPRSRQQGTQERVKILDIIGDTITCITVNSLKVEQTYTINISDIRLNY